jgi:ferredoxin-NADP reductase
MSHASPARKTLVARSLSRLSQSVWASGQRYVVPALDRASTRVQLDVPLLEVALSKLDPTLSLRSVRAEVVAIAQETADTNTFWLRPNARFGSFRPGCFVNVRLPVDGRVIERSYSLSSAPRADGLISITVKRVPGGHCSNYLAEHVRVGQVLELSAPQGRFLLPEVIPDKLLMLSGGSGITPVMSMLRKLVAEGSRAEIVFMHFARTPQDVIFHAELTQIARDHSNVKLVLCVEDAGAEPWDGAVGRFRVSLLAQHVPAFAELDTFLCGPSGFMQAVMTSLEQADADLSKLRYERFNVELDASRFLNHAQVIRFVRSGTESVSNRPRTILEEAELAGLQVEFGCRAGNCGTCRCRKMSGIVVDLNTGVESSGADEFIYPCVSVARGTVEVEL